MMITTIYGPMDDDLLTKREGDTDNANERTHWVEYWYRGECVHRSADIILKQWPAMTGELGRF
jgi:hypothetical protein